MKKKILPVICAVVTVILAAVLTVTALGDYETMRGWQRDLYASLYAEKLRETKFIGKPSEDTWSPEDEYRLEDTAVLLKDPKRDFVVMNVTDLHMSEFSYTYLNNITANRTLYYIRLMAKELKPDLITISGDIFCEDGESNVNAVHRLTEFMDSLGIPWAPVFDWHDEQANCDLNYIADVMMTSEYCLLKKGDSALGSGNYIINVCEEGEDSVNILHSILMMHTHHGNFYESQIEWYKWAMNGVAAVNGSPVESSVIMHVPIIQYRYAYEEAWDEESGAWREGSGAFGWKMEGVDCEEEDSGFFDAVLELGSTKNIICGHDHVNSFSILYEGVRLTYSMRLSLGGYFDDTFETDNTGATLLIVGENGAGAVTHHYIYDTLYPDGKRAR